MAVRAAISIRIRAVQVARGSWACGFLQKRSAQVFYVKSPGIDVNHVNRYMRPCPPRQALRRASFPDAPDSPIDIDLRCCRFFCTMPRKKGCRIRNFRPYGGCRGVDVGGWDE